MVALVGRSAVGVLPVSPELEKTPAGYTNRHNGTALQNFGDQELVIESIRPRKTVFLVGGGNVSKAVADLIRHLDFRTVVFDDRAEFADSERFPSVDVFFVCPEYRLLFDGFNINADSYILIVTRGHRLDKNVLSQALKTKAGYIGMIGSRKKRDYTYRELRDEGIDNRQLDRFYCPVVISINAETPAEIGGSIVAEIIRHRAGQRAHGRP